MSFSTDIANNLIEKKTRNECGRGQYSCNNSVLGWGGPSATAKERGSKERQG
jgi:hypothetical protein